MSDEPRQPGGELELLLLTALWEPRAHQPTVRELYEAVGRPRGVVYTTVAKVLDRMVDKKLVARRRAGRAFTYRPLVKQGETQRRLLRDALGRIFGDRPLPAMAALVGALEDVSPDLLDELSAELMARKAGRDGT